MARPIKRPEVWAKVIIEDQDTVGYLKIGTFYTDVFREVMQTMERVGRDMAVIDDWIIDLRGNPGGVLEETIKLLNQIFYDQDIPLINTLGTQGVVRSYTSTGRSFLRIGRIVILCDSASASASEIVAGVLQDHDRAVLIGSDTYGKGYIQQVFDLSNSGALRLTTGAYQLPGGRRIGIGQDTIYTTLHNGRKLRPSNGIPVDLESSYCTLPSDATVKAYLLGLWQGKSGIAAHDHMMSGVSESCKTFLTQHLTWRKSLYMSPSDLVIRSSDIDGVLSQAWQVITSKDYEDILSRDQSLIKSSSPL